MHKYGSVLTASVFQASYQTACLAILAYQSVKLAMNRCSTADDDGTAVLNRTNIFLTKLLNTNALCNLYSQQQQKQTKNITTPKQVYHAV